MKNVLEQYLDKHQKGLLLLDMPTGSGKTYAVIDYIASHIDTFKQQQRKLIFITPMKKNLPYKELEAQLHKIGKGQYYDSEVLLVKSTIDNFIEHFEACKSAIECLFPAFLSNDLALAVKLAQQPFFRENAEQQIYTLANQLAYLIRQYFLDNYDSVEARLKLIKEDSDWHWVTQLFPASLTIDRSVIFMTVSKFITPYKTLIEPSVAFDQLLKNHHTTLFIDEIDSAKKYIQNHIIEQSLKNSIELIPTVNQIASRLKESSFPNHLVSNHILDQQTATPIEIEAGFRQGASEIVEKYQLQLNLKTQADFDTSKRSFIFYDKTEYYLGNAHNKRLLLAPDPQNHMLWINAIPYKPNEKLDNKTVNQLLAESRRYLNYFKGGLNMLANHYYYSKLDFTGISPDNAIATYLDFFRLPEQFVKNITNELQYSRLNKKWSGRTFNKNEDSLSATEKLYEYGFVYHMIIDSENHAGRSRIQSYNFPCTAEVYLSSWCQDFMVVGVSATANIDTRLGNFDLHYIQQKLADKDNQAQFFTLNDNQRHQLNQQFTASKSHYEQVAIHCHWHEGIDINAQHIEVKEKYLTLFNNDDRYNPVIDKILVDIDGLVNSAPDVDNTYHYAQYFKIFELWLNYLQQDIKAFLLLLNRGYQNKSLALIKDFCQTIAKANHYPTRLADDEIIVVLGAEADQQIEAIHTKLRRGQSCFVLSTYPTLGAGKNIQYPLPDNDLHWVKINDFAPSRTIDFDGIYLANPTNVLVNVNSNDRITEQNFVNFIYQLEYLQVAGLSQKDFKFYLEKGFQAFDTGKPVYRFGAENLYKTADYKKQIMQILIQALGRICRTNLKRPNIRLHLDQTILENWTDDLNGIPLLPEFQHIQKEVHQLKGDWLNYANDLGSILTQSNDTIKNTIDNILKKFSLGMADDKLVAIWQGLRELCLKYPQVISEDNYHKLYEVFDTVVNRYYFHQLKDYQYVKTSITRMENWQSIGLDSARLAVFMQHPSLKRYFEQQGYATEITPATTWLNPVMFNNIYKGALGEVCGKFLWENDYGLPKLTELPLPHYEKFDYQLSPFIHIDFKHWQQNYQNGELNRDKIFEKMDIMGSKLVLVINMINDGQNQALYKIHHSDDNSKEIMEIANFLPQSQSFELIKKIRERITAYEND